MQRSSYSRFLGENCQVYSIIRRLVMKIALCEFHQETNSFNPIKRTLDDYRKVYIYEGEEMFQLRDKPCAMAGKYAAIEEVGETEIIPLISMFAQSGGTVEHEVVDYFLARTISGLKNNLPIDGVFIGFHGATQSDVSDDVCGDILKAIRETVGKDCVLTASTDLHANITEKFVQNADYITGYHTYPHIDYFETGYRAAKFGLEKITGRRNLVMAWSSVPMIVPPSSYTTMNGAFKEVMDYAADLVEKGELADFSIYQMQPWLDVDPAQSSVLTISENPGKAKKYANDLARKLFDSRTRFVQTLYSVDDVLTEAEQNLTGKPFILVHSSDSPGAGATCDNAVLLDVIDKRDSNIKAALYLNDSPAAEHAFEVGVGNEGIFSIGASLDNQGSSPVVVKARVVSLHDGYYTQEGPAQRGRVNFIGRTAVVHWKNTDIILCGNVLGPGDPQLYRHFGIEPGFYQLISIKACTSWRIAYEPIAGKIFETDLPGNAPLNLFRAKYNHLPKHFYPFEEITMADIRQA